MTPEEHLERADRLLAAWATSDADNERAQAHALVAIGMILLERNAISGEIVEPAAPKRGRLIEHLVDGIQEGSRGKT